MLAADLFRCLTADLTNISSRCKEEYRDVQHGERNSKPRAMLTGLEWSLSALKNCRPFAYDLTSNHVWGCFFLFGGGFLYLPKHQFLEQ